jgi:hypothetical protein
LRRIKIHCHLVYIFFMLKCIVLFLPYLNNILLEV